MHSCKFGWLLARKGSQVRDDRLMNRRSLLTVRFVGQEGFDKIRVLSYKGADMFIICFAISSRHSFLNAGAKWVRELSQHPDAARTPYLLVGTKCDLRTDETNHEVSVRAGVMLVVSYVLM
jgi:GTPase SAR1 family protein